MKLTCRGVFTGLFSVFGVCWMLPAAEVPIDQRLPEEVVVYASCPNGAQLAERFAETNFGQMINDPALADFRAEIEEGLSRLLADAEEESGLNFADLVGLIEGEVAFAVVAPRGETMGMVMMLEYGVDNESLMDELIGHMQDGIKRSEPSAEMTVDTIEGVEVTMYEFETERDNPFNTLCYFRNDGQLCIASSPAAVESILVRWDGSHSSTLADSDIYGYIMEKCAVDGRPGDLQYFIDPIGLMNSVFGLSPDFAMVGFMVQGQLTNLGLNTLHGFGGTMHMATEQFDSESHSFIYVDQPAKGVMQVFSCPVADLTPPDWVSADVQQYQCINWDIQSAYSAVESMYDTFNRQPGAFSSLIDGLALQAPGRLHIKDDVIDLFSGQVHITSSMADPNDVTSQQMLFALAVEDADDARDLIETLIEESNGNIEERDFQGETIYEGRASGGNGPFERPAFAILNGLLVIGSSPEAVEGIIRASGSESPLSQSKSFALVREHLPAEVSMFGYAESESQIAALYEMARNGDLDAATEGAVDFGLLPEFEELSHYFTPSASYAVPDDNGALFVGFGLKADSE